MKNKTQLKRGIGLAEVLIAIFIFSSVLTAVIYASNQYISGSSDNLRSAQGAFLAEEGIEAIKTIRDNNWTNISSLSTTTTYYLQFNATTSLWGATTTVSTVNGLFTRKFNLFDVKRDSNGRVVLSGGTIDPKSKKITVSVTWIAKSGTTTKSLSTYITNLVLN